MLQTPRKLTTIDVIDPRGTSIRIQLFLCDKISDDYADELWKLWQELYAGSSDSEIYVDGEAWVRPQIEKKQDLHGSWTSP